MARTVSSYVCQSCGAASGKWAGRCEACGAWNSIVEEAPREGGFAPAEKAGAGGTRARRARAVPLEPMQGTAAPPPRRVTGIAELDRVTGGGLVAGSALLVGGDPGIGKSTLLLQAAAALAIAGARVAYISGEEAVDQIRLRAARLGLGAAPLLLAAATGVRDILAALEGPEAPEVVIVDSIQTMYVDTLDSAPGTVAQVRAAAHELIRHAKRRGAALLLVGHVTKEGTIAGPRVLEHMVDTVLYFEGDRGYHYRILRATKNRFGPADEIGVFEMTGKGLVEVANPSALFLAGHAEGVAGSAVFAGIEGSRPLLVEIQALVTPAPPGSPRRAVVGWDSGRLAMVLAVLAARCGLSFAAADVYLNVAGGLRIGEPGADLAVAAALVSALLERELPEGMVAFGEIGLGGEVRAVAQPETRLREAAKLGFRHAMVPAVSTEGEKALAAPKGLTLAPLAHVRDLVRLVAGEDLDLPRAAQ